MNNIHSRVQDQKNHKPTPQKTQQQKSRQMQGPKKHDSGATQGTIRHDQELPETRMFR